MLLIRPILLPAIAAASIAAAPGAPIRTQQGLVTGTTGRDPAIRIYKGLPFAAAPTGPRRFRAPAPAATWRGVRRADRFGDVCPQLAADAANEPMSEDCLNLNVWTRARSSNERRAVFVWIYGGGFNQGFGSSAQFDGEGLAKKGVVVVTFNYRLGPLGFLATPELSRESGHAASGNFGILDQIAALRWVKRNIAAFGGDPSKVTIAGQSAGAGSVGFLSTSPLARGLFRAGIAESQVRHPGDLELRYLNTSWRSLTAAEQAGQAFAAGKGAASLAALRALPWRAVMARSNGRDESVDTGSDISKPPLFRPVVDGWVIPQSYAGSLAANRYANIAYVAGNNLDESGAVPETAFDQLRRSKLVIRAGLPTTNVTLDDFTRRSRQKFGAMADEFLHLYPATTDDDAARASNAAIRDNARVSTYLWGQLWKPRKTKPLFTYFWTHALPGPTRPSRGAFHGSEINYVFNNLYATDLPWTADDRHIADIMSSYWANITKTGDPNGPGLPRWPAFNGASPSVMEVGDRFVPSPVAEPAKLDFWRRFFASQQAW